MSDLISALSAHYGASDPDTTPQTPRRPQDPTAADRPLVPGGELLRDLTNAMPRPAGPPQVGAGPLRGVDYVILQAYRDALPEDHPELPRVRGLLNAYQSPEAVKDGMQRAEMSGFLIGGKLTPAGEFQAVSLLSRAR